MDNKTIRKELSKIEPKLVKARMKVASLEAQENVLFELLNANEGDLEDVCVD